MGWLNNLLGTISNIFQIGEGGPQWKNNSGTLEARNFDDTGYVPVIDDANTVTPAALAAQADDYAPTGIEDVGVLRVSTDSGVPRTITGIQAPSPARVQHIFITNLGPGTVNLSDNNGASAAVNRFLMNGNHGLASNDSTHIWYDVTSSRWRRDNA